MIAHAHYHGNCRVRPTAALLAVRRQPIAPCRPITAATPAPGHVTPSQAIVSKISRRRAPRAGFSVST
jgi:hypothetical protein